MKRWRVVGVHGVPTPDRRMLSGRVTVRPGAIPLRDARGRKGHEGARLVGPVAVRIRSTDQQIEALLPWRYRHANLDTRPRLTEWHDELTDGPEALLVLLDPEIVALTVTDAPNAWAGLR